MSLNRHNPKRDANESVFTDILTELGYAWWPVSSASIPDLLVLVRGEWRLLEIKSQQGKLTAAQYDFFAYARAHEAKHLYIVRTVEELMEALK